MRRQGALDEIRSVLFDGVHDVGEAGAADFEQVSSRMLKNSMTPTVSTGKQWMN